MTFEELKRKADSLKTKRDQALGAIKSIEDGWEKKYGTRDVKVLEEKLKSMNEELVELDNDINSKMNEAEALLAGAV